MAIDVLMLKPLVGKTCIISTGTINNSRLKGKILEVNENWMKIKTKTKTIIISIDYISSIRYDE